MPSKPIIYLNGLFWPLDQANVSILDRGFTYGDGLFETLRSYSSKIFKFEEHLDRLFQSARLIFIELPMTRNEIISAVYKTIEINDLSDSIIRITVTRGVQEPGIIINHDLSPTVVIHARPIVPIPKKTYEKGVAISLFKNSATKISGISKQIKSCNYLSHIILKEKALKEGSFEGIMLDHENNVTEGTTSNIFVIKNNEIRCPKLNEFVLSGVTRQVIFNIASANKILFKEKNHGK